MQTHHSAVYTCHHGPSPGVSPIVMTCLQKCHKPAGNSRRLERDCLMAVHYKWPRSIVWCLLVLVNNVGVMYDYPQYFLDVPVNVSCVVFYLCLSFKRTELIMAALWNRADHYIFILWFLLSIFYLFFLTQSQRSQSGCLPYFTHGVALVHI